MKKYIEIIERMMFAMANYKVDGIRIQPTLYAAKDAMEKQMPKKATLDIEFTSGIRWYICPSCGGSIRSNTKEAIQNGETTYCEHCGQALDWSHPTEKGGAD